MTLTKDYFVSKAKYARLELEVPFIEMAEEAKALKEKYITHRDGSYDHKGWRSLVLHGLSERKSGHWKDYGYDSIEQVMKDMHWTEVSNECPVTVNFIKNHFPSHSFGRVRFMLLEAGGHIGLHSDTQTPLLENTNISLTNPEGCKWIWGDGETVDMSPGGVYVMNIHYPHSVYNYSKEDRYHLIVHRLDCTNKWKSLLDDACMQQDISGEYVNHEVLV